MEARHINTAGNSPSQGFSEQRRRSFGPISTLERLRDHLQWAMELGHFTIPPYLCALYSLDTSRNLQASEVIRSILVEEMPHLMLAANLLNAGV